MSKNEKCGCCGKYGKLKKVLGGIGIGLIVAIFVLFVLRDIIIEHSVEQVGSYLTGTPIEIGRFYTSILGRVEIKDFSVANPPGYTHPHAIELAEVVIDLNPLSVLTDRIKINQIKIDGMGVNYSVGFGKSNLGEIMDHINEVTAKSERDAAEPEKRPAPSTPEEKEEAKEEAEVSKKVEITELSISGNHVSFGGWVIPLGGITMHDIGKESDTSIAEVINEVFATIFKSTVEACKSAGSSIGDAAGKAADSVSEMGKDAIKAIKDLF